ncbi:MAG: hypothetical protein ACK5IQ_11080 [Bacteroidales bacterium]
MKKLILSIIMLATLGCLQAQDCSCSNWSKYVINFDPSSVINQQFRKTSSIGDYTSYDFSDIIANNSQHYIGYFGEDKQRFRFVVLEVKRSFGNKMTYNVRGISNVNKSPREFWGTLTIKGIKGFNDIYNEIDSSSVGEIKDRGLLIGDFEFKEKKRESATGVFSGVYAARWYIDSDDNMRYDDIAKDSEYYWNNQYCGKWKSYKSNETTKCAWGHADIPCMGDLNVGEGEFVPNPKYNWGNMEFDWEKSVVEK